MTLKVYFGEDIEGVLASTMSMALATAQSAIQTGGQVNSEYLSGVFSSQRAAAIAFNLSWKDVVYKALYDVGGLDAIAGQAEQLARKPLHQLIAEIEQELAGTS